MFWKRTAWGTIVYIILTWLYYRTSSKPIPLYLFLTSYPIGLLYAYWTRNWHPLHDLLREKDDNTR